MVFALAGPEGRGGAGAGGGAGGGGVGIIIRADPKVLGRKLPLFRKLSLQPLEGRRQERKDGVIKPLDVK